MLGPNTKGPGLLACWDPNTKGPGLLVFWLLTAWWEDEGATDEGTGELFIWGGGV